MEELFDCGVFEGGFDFDWFSDGGDVIDLGVGVGDDWDACCADWGGGGGDEGVQASAWSVESASAAGDAEWSEATESSIEQVDIEVSASSPEAFSADTPEWVSWG